MFKACINEASLTTSIYQLTSMEDVIIWFKQLEKNRYKLMKFYIEQFYPSNDEQLLLKALNFANWI